MATIVGTTAAILVLALGAAIGTSTASATDDFESECAQGQQLIEGRCVTPVPTCADGESLVDGQCVAPAPAPAPTCATGQVLVNGACVAQAPDCGAKQIVINGACTDIGANTETACTSKEILVDGRCANITSEPGEVADVADEPGATVDDGAVAGMKDAPAGGGVTATVATPVVRSGVLPYTGLAARVLAALGAALVLGGMAIHLITIRSARRDDVKTPVN